MLVSNNHFIFVVAMNFVFVVAMNNHFVVIDTTMQTDSLVMFSIRDNKLKPWIQLHRRPAEPMVPTIKIFMSTSNFRIHLWTSDMDFSCAALIIARLG
jgi:hypothetical protein